MKRTDYFLSVIIGTIFIFVLAIVLSFVISLLLQFSTVKEASLHVIVTVISFISLFIGGLIAGRKGKEKGWLLGASTGVCYTLIIFLIQFLGYDEVFTYEQIIFHTGYIIVAICGGIVGVNMLKGNHKVD